MEATLHWVVCGDAEKKHGQIDGQLRNELLEMLPPAAAAAAAAAGDDGQAILVADTSIGIMIDISRINATWN